MKPRENNHAYIDGANLHKGIGELGWALDYQRFRRWLKDKYAVSRAYLFIGLIPKNKNLYTFLSMLLARNKLKSILAPNHTKCSILLKRTKAKITFLDEFRHRLAKKEKAPGKDGTSQGSFS